MKLATHVLCYHFSQRQCEYRKKAISGKSQNRPHRSEKQTGGQPGYAGRTLMQTASPDEDGATAFCRIRSYLSTMRNQGHSMLTALAAVFAGQPLPIAWAPV